MNTSAETPALGTVAELYPGAIAGARPYEKTVQSTIDVSHRVGFGLKVGKVLHSPFVSDLGGRLVFSGTGIITGLQKNEGRSSNWRFFTLEVSYTVIEWKKDGRVVALSADFSSGIKHGGLRS